MEFPQTPGIPRRILRVGSNPPPGPFVFNDFAEIRPLTIRLLKARTPISVWVSNLAMPVRIAPARRGSNVILRTA